MDLWPLFWVAVAVGLTAYNITDRICDHRERMKKNVEADD